MGGSLNSVGKDPAALTAGRCRLASGVAAPSTCRRGIPAGAARRIGGLGEVPTPHRRRSGQHRAARVRKTHEGLRGFSEPRRPDCFRRAPRDSQDSYIPHPLRGRKPLFPPPSVALCQGAPFGRVGCSRVLHRSQLCKRRMRAPRVPECFGSYPRPLRARPMATPTRAMPAIQPNAHLVPPS